MSRTYKKCPNGHYRSMSGYRQALTRKITREDREDGIPAERYKAIPPNPWDDGRHDSHCNIPSRAAENMKDQGISRESAIRKLCRKFGLSYAEAVEMTSWIYKW